MMPFSDEDLQAPVSSIIKNKIAPMLARDGGAIEHCHSSVCQETNDLVP